MKFRYIPGLIIMLATISFSQLKKDSDLLFQVSTIDALLSGIFDGDVSVANLLQQGNFGIGTFNTLDGEMVVLDGVCYQIRSDGKVNIPALTTKSPFAAVTSFETDTTFSVPGVVSLEQLEAKIDSSISSVNMIYAVRITGRFVNATARSVPAQKAPYRKLTEITKTQPVFSFSNRHGTLAGFRCPVFFKGINVPGYHLHLITDDKKEGGHLLSMTADSLTVEIDKTDSFKVVLPHDDFFLKADFTGDKGNELKKVEK